MTCTRASTPWIAALIVIGAFVYLPALGGVFTFDDYPWILENPHLADVTTYGWQRRPVALLSFAANLRMHGPNPVGFHVINIGLHLANAGLVFALLRRALPAASSQLWAAFAGALLFLVHPAQTDAVTYISGRATSLMTLWLLLAHLAAMRSVTNPRWSVPSVCAFALAVGSKEVALVYPVLLSGWLALGERRVLGASARAALPHWIAALCLVLAMHAHAGYRSLLGEAIAGGRHAASPEARLENRLGLGFCFNYGQPRADSCVAARIEGLSGLTQVLAFPWMTNIDHGRRVIRVADIAIAAAAVGALFIGLRSGPGALAAGSAWIVAALIPTTLVVVRSDPVADRLLYLPMVGVALAVGSVLQRVPASPGRWPLAAALAALSLVLGSLTIARNFQYQSEVALWEDAVRKGPGNARARVNLGYAYELRGDLDAAEREYRSAAALSPGLRWAEAGMAAVRVRRDQQQGRH